MDSRLEAAQQKLEPRVEDMRDASRLAQRLTTPSSDYALPPRAADPEFDEGLEPGDLNWLEPPPPSATTLVSGSVSSSRALMCLRAR